MRISVARSAIPSEEVKVLDINARHLGLRTIMLMENAGAAVAKHVQEAHQTATTIGVLCGRGNNGGDGFVAARHLSNDREVAVYTLEEPSDSMSDLAMVNLGKVRDISRDIEAFSARNHDLIIDAMLGVGLAEIKSALK